MTNMSARLSTRTAAAVTLLTTGALVGASSALASDIIYETNDPFGGFIGLNGFDVSEIQSVGVRFTPTADYTLNQVSMWFMNNDTSGTGNGFVTLTLRNDAESKSGGSIPGELIYETWEFQISSIGWDPVLESVTSVEQPMLEAGVNYWVVAVSDAPTMLNPVWCIAANDNGFATSTTFGRGAWQDGGFGAVPCTIVEGNAQIREFSLSISNGLKAGQDATFAVSGALPSKTVWLAYSLSGAGSQPVPQLGITLDIDRPRQVGEPFEADANGTAETLVSVPLAAQGRTVYFQAAQQLGESVVVMDIVQ